MRRTKYHPSYGYVTQTGGNLGDMFKLVSNFVTQPAVADVISKGVKTAADTGAKTIGDRLGKKIADKLIPATPSQEIRKNVLKELKLYKDKPAAEPAAAPDSQYGFGRRKKIRGRGIKVLT